MKTTRGIGRLSSIALLALISVNAWSQAPATAPGDDATAPAPAPQPRFAVAGYKVTGNTLLPAADIEAALVPFGGERQLDELKRAAAAVQALYARAGYGAVVAFVPAQAPVDGIVGITVIEGKLTRVSVNGQQQFDEANIRASLPGLALGATPRLNQVDTQIQLTNENPAKQVQVLLQPGQQPGEVEARVTVTEAPVQRWSLGLDNTGSERTGDHRINLGWQHANVAGLDHVLTTQFQTSVEKPQLVTVASAGYRMPFYAQSLALDAFAAYSDVDGGTSATLAGDLQFAGKGRIYGLRLSRYLPRLGEYDQRLSLGLEHRAYLNTCQIVGLPVGACGPAGESVAVQPLSLDYSLQLGGNRPVGASVSLLHNLALGGSHTQDADFGAVRAGAQARYTLLRASVSAGASFADEWQIHARLSGQFTHDALVPGEQFGLGGASTVRGYQEREVTGDRGILGTLEVVSPDIAKALGLGAGSLRLVGFADFGHVDNLLGTPCRGELTACSLASVGIGWRFVSGNLQARVFIAHALDEGPHTGRHDTRAHLALSFSF